MVAGPWRRRCCHCRCRPGACCWQGIHSRRRLTGRCDFGTRGCSYPPLWHHKTGSAPSFHDTAAITATSLSSLCTPRVLSGRDTVFRSARRKSRQLLRMRTHVKGVVCRARKSPRTGFADFIAPFASRRVRKMSRFSKNQMRNPRAEVSSRLR